jgi:hypothetical protein
MRYPRSNGARPAISAATPGARVDLRWRCGGAGPPIRLDAPAFPRHGSAGESGLRHSRSGRWTGSTSTPASPPGSFFVIQLPRARSRALRLPRRAGADRPARTRS